MRAPVGSPPGPAGASSSSPSSGLPGSLQAATPAPPSHSLIHSVLSFRSGPHPSERPARKHKTTILAFTLALFFSLVSLCSHLLKGTRKQRSWRGFVPRRGVSRPDARDTVSVITRHARARDGCRFDTEKHSHARPVDVHKYCGCSLATEPPTQGVRNTCEAPRGPSPFTRAEARHQNIPRTRVHGVRGRTKTRHFLCNRLLDFEFGTLCM